MTRKEKKQRDLEITAAYSGGKDISSIAEHYDLDPSYVRYILRKDGHVVPRKFVRSDSEKLRSRNEGIVTAYNTGEDLESIAHRTKISATRVKQILIASGVFHSTKNKKQVDTEALELAQKMREDIKNCVPYEGPDSIREKYGKAMIDRCKRAGINIFREAYDFRLAGILADYNNMAMTVKDIAKKYRCTRDYVFFLLKQARESMPAQAKYRRDPLVKPNKKSKALKKNRTKKL